LLDFRSLADLENWLGTTEDPASEAVRSPASS